jgi:hypothetical protein
MAEAHALLADLLIAQRARSRAIALREACGCSRKAVNIHFALVSQLLRQGAWPRPTRRCRRCRRWPRNHPSRATWSRLWDFRENRLTEARDACMQVLKDAPQFLPAELLAGTVLVRLNEHALARSHLERVLAGGPGN